MKPFGREVKRLEETRPALRCNSNIFRKRFSQARLSDCRPGLATALPATVSLLEGHIYNRWGSLSGPVASQDDSSCDMWQSTTRPPLGHVCTASEMKHSAEPLGVCSLVPGMVSLWYYARAWKCAITLPATVSLRALIQSFTRTPVQRRRSFLFMFHIPPPADI